MPVTLSGPNVYIEEVPSSVRTITGAGTSVAAFVGYTSRGPVGKAVRVFDVGSFERQFGGLHRDSEISYAIQQFFLGGGTDAWVVRAANGASAASVTLQANEGTGSLELSASSEGSWGNYLKVDVDYSTSNPDASFNLTVTEYRSQAGVLVASRSETFRNLGMDSSSSSWAVGTLANSSTILRALRPASVNAGVLSGLPAGWSQSGDVAGVDLATQLTANTRYVAISLDGEPFQEVNLFDPSAIPTSLADLATSLQTAVRALKPGVAPYGDFTAGVVSSAGTARFLRLTSGTAADAGREHSSVRVMAASSNDAARLLQLGLAAGGREGGGSAALRPLPGGNVSTDLALVALNNLPTNVVTMTVADGPMNVSGSFSLSAGSGQNSFTAAQLAELASVLQGKIRSAGTAPAFSRAVVKVAGTRLQILSGIDNSDARITFSEAAPGLVDTLGLNTTSNVQRVSLGLGKTAGFQVKGNTGLDGTAPGAADLKGNLNNKSGLYALEDVPGFNLLCIPRTADLPESDGLAVISEATSYCIRRRAFFLVDPPARRNTLTGSTGIQEWMAGLTPERNAAVYWPQVMIPDPQDGFRVRAMAASGTVAGLIARTDSARGVWKAPAGTEATLANVQGLAYHITDSEAGVLNPLAINCLRTLPVYGRVAWGARTSRGADTLADEYKYVPIRRLALHVEESLFRGTQWAIFEPNDEPLWAQLRLNIGAFMHNLFRQGAFQGTSPRDAYFVKCDRETTTQSDIDRGIVNILVGFAPLKPAEFIIIRLQQIAGQLGE